MFFFRSGALGLHGSDPPRTTLSPPIRDLGHGGPFPNGPRGCAPLTLTGGYAWIHIHTPEPDFFGSTCQMRSTPHGAYMGPQATITTTPPIQSAAATAWGYLRLRPIPLAPIGALLHVAGGTCGAKREPERGSQITRMRRKGAEFEA